MTITCRSAAVGGRGNLKSSSETGLVRSLTISEVASAALAHRLMALHDDGDDGDRYKGNNDR